MNHEKKIPLIRLAKRDGMEGWKVWCIRFGSIVFALLLGALVMALAGASPVTAYGTMISGALGKKSAIRQTVKIAVPLLGCALAIAPCFKMRFWNIGAEGQITAGAIAASYFALFWAGRLPSPVLLVVMGVSGAIAGGVWALIPAFFKARWNTNETLFTLMMNYIVIGVVRWLQGGPWEGRKGSQIIPQFDSAACLPRVLGVHCGWIIVLVLVVFMHVYMNHTKHGYEIAVIGDSVNTARYAGMNAWGSPPSPWPGSASSTPSPWWPSPCCWRFSARGRRRSRPAWRCPPPSPTSSPAFSSSACWGVSSSSTTS